MLIAHNLLKTFKMETMTRNSSAITAEEQAAPFDLDSAFDSILATSALVQLSDSERASLDAKGMTEKHYKRSDRMERLFIEALQSVGKFSLCL